MDNIIFVDGSYYCFFRYYAILSWWKRAKPDIILDDPYDNPEFVAKFKKMFVEKFREIPKKLGIPNAKVIVSQDCRSDDIWRKALFPEYKANRKDEEGQFMGGPFFKLAYDELFEETGIVELYLSHPKLEADDCIAIMVKEIYKTGEAVQTYVITSDKDYLQLATYGTKFFDLKFKQLFEDAGGLICKILTGDKVDNIPSVFPKCGPKTALKCKNDPIYLKQQLDKHNAHEKYKLNETLMSFDCIPEQYCKELLCEDD